MLGYAGLLPQVAALAVVVGAGHTWGHSAALALSYAYAALILSFLGGMWWGFAARRSEPPGWVWLAAVAPSLVALAAIVLWIMAGASVRALLAILGASLIASLLVDRRLASDGLTPGWWMTLRVPLSFGLGSLTLAIAVIG